MKKYFVVLISLLVVVGLVFNTSYVDAKSKKEIEADKKKMDEMKENMQDPTKSQKQKNEEATETYKESSNPKYKKNKVKQKTDDLKKKAFATVLFKDGNANDTMFYYKSQTQSGAKSVEGVLEDKHLAKNDATAYASYLNSLYEWNLYSTYTDQKDVIIGLLTGLGKFIYGLILLGCMYLMSAIDGLLTIFAKLFDYFNIFKYVTNEAGQIDEDSSLAFLNPVISFLQQLTTLAKVAITIFIGWIAFRLATGVGRARNRGSYFKTGFAKIMYSLIAMAAAALFLSASFGLISDVLKKTSGVATGAVDDVPTGIIVDTQQYIDNSLKSIKGKKGEEATNDGYVLNHSPKQGFPTTPDEVKNKIPSKKLVTYMNTNNDEDLKEKLSGKDILKTWAFSTNYTANDINSIYKLDDDAGFWGPKDKKERLTQFKLSPEAQGVKLYGGKKAFSFDLKDISIESAVLAGNTGFGVFLNGLKLGFLIIGISWVVIVLYLSVFTGLINALKDSITNFALSQVGFYRAFFGLFFTVAITMLSIGVVFALVSIFPNMVTDLDNEFINQLNKDDKWNGLLKQLLSTTVTLFVLWFSSFFVFKIRKGIIGGVQAWFTQILDALNPDAGLEGSMAGMRNADKQALENASNSNLFGQEYGENSLDEMKNPYQAGKNGVQSLQDLKNKSNQKIQSLGAMMNGEEGQEGNGTKYDSSGKTSSDFSGSVSGANGDVEDADVNGEKLEQDIQKGIDDMDKDSDRAVNKNLNEQEDSINHAQKQFENLNDADKELQDAKDNYERLKQNGASPEELAAAKERVSEAQGAYDKQLGLSQEASRYLARTGASVGDIADGRVQSMQDYHNANEELQNAQDKVTDLKDQRDEMKAMGASAYDIERMDERIGEAQDNVDVIKEKQNLAKQAYDANVNNPQAEKDARNDVLSATQAEKDANRQYAQAQKTGNLTQQQQGHLKQAATALDQDLAEHKSDLDNQVRNGEVKRNALNFMKNNGGKAFTNADFQQQEKELERADNQVSQVQQQLQQAKSNKAPKSEISSLNKELENAQVHQANVQQAAQTMQYGNDRQAALEAQQQKVQQAKSQVSQVQQQLQQAKSSNAPKSEISSLNKQLENAQVHQAGVQRAAESMRGGMSTQDALNAQKQVVAQTQQQRVTAEKDLKNLRRQENAGQLGNRDQIKAAETKFQQSYAAHQHAERMMSGIEAVNTVGQQETKPEKLQVMSKDNDNNLETLYNQQAKAATAQQAVGALGRNEQISPKQASNISTTQKQVRAKASEKAKNATNQYRKTKEKLDMLKRQEKNGMPVRSEVQRQEASLSKAKEHMDKAKNKEQFIANRGVEIRNVGRAMQNNIKNARTSITDKAQATADRKQKHQDILRTGGVSNEQLQNYKKQIAQDRQSSQENQQRFIRERSSRLMDIRKKLENN